MPRGRKKAEPETSVVENNSVEDVSVAAEVRQDDGCNMQDILQEALIALRAKEARKKGIKVSNGFMSLDDIPSDTQLPLTAFPLQYVFGRQSFKPGTLIEIIGPEHVGKTTFVFSLLGMFMTACDHIPALYVNTEGRNKLFDNDRLKSCLSKSKAQADKFFKQILMFEGHAQKETLEAIDNWCMMTREIMTKNGIPDTTPILVAVDSLSKLIPVSEAKKFGYGDAAKANGLGESSNLEFSKMLQEWCRGRVEFLEKYNVFMILVSLQNTKINMSAIPGQRPVSDANNKTKIGGNAINQSAVTQFTLTRVDSIQHTVTKELISHIIKLNVVKNSRGPDKRFINYALRVGQLEDTDTTYEGAIDFNYGIPDMFALKHVLSTVMKTKNSFTCRPLKATGDLSREEFINLFINNPELIAEVGKDLGIFGYKQGDIDPFIKKQNLQIAEEPVVELDEATDSSFDAAVADDTDDL